MSEITVITASIPGREKLLAENVESVHVQTVQTACHLIRTHHMDEDGNPAKSYNALVEAAETEWIHVLDDDNYWLPKHIETITPYLENADVVYAFDAGGSRPKVDLSGLSQLELIRFFRTTNCVDQSAAVRRDIWLACGGMRGHLEIDTQWPDQDLWWRLAKIGARFVCVSQETWIYRTRPYAPMVRLLPQDCPAADITA